MVYFRKVNINKSTNSATIIDSDTPVEAKKATLAGINVATRSQSNIKFGVLSLIDPETNETMKANHPSIATFQKQLNVGDKMEGFQLSGNAVKDMQTGEDTTLMWVEAV